MIEILWYEFPPTRDKFKRRIHNIDSVKALINIHMIWSKPIDKHNFFSQRCFVRVFKFFCRLCGIVRIRNRMRLWRKRLSSFPLYSLQTACLPDFLIQSKNPRRKRRTLEYPSNAICLATWSTDSFSGMLKCTRIQKRVISFPLPMILLYTCFI